VGGGDMIEYIPIQVRLFEDYCEILMFNYKPPVWSKYIWKIPEHLLKGLDDENKEI